MTSNILRHEVLGVVEDVPLHGVALYIARQELVTHEEREQVQGLGNDILVMGPLIRLAILEKLRYVVIDISVPHYSIYTITSNC